MSIWANYQLLTNKTIKTMDRFNEMELQIALEKRAALQRNSLNNFSIEMQNSFAEENAIQKAQRENREKWAQARVTHKEAMRNITEQYQTQAIKIKAEANEKLQAVIAERRKQSNNIAGASAEPQEWRLIETESTI